MDQRLQVLLFPLHLSPSDTARATKPAGNDANAEADVLVVGLSGALDRPSTTAPSASPPAAPAQVPIDLGTRDSPIEGVAAAALESRTGLAARLHYACASYLSELERGRVLSRCTVADIAASTRTAPGCASAADGLIHHYVYPVEDGRYVAAVTVPTAVRVCFGSAMVPLLMLTAVRGYDVAAAVAQRADVPTYFPLHGRLRENSAAVQRALQARVAQVEALARMASGRSSEGGSAVSFPWVDPLCQMGTQSLPSPARVPAALHTALHRLLRSATQPTHTAALSGALASVGTGAGGKRFRVASAAVWRAGEPLYLQGRASHSLTRELLTSAAIAVTMDSILGSTASVSTTTTAPRIQFKCIAVRAPMSEWASGVGTMGFTLPAAPVDKVSGSVGAGGDAPALAVAFTSGPASWTVALLLEPVPSLFEGAPLPYILSGMHEMLARQLDTLPLTALLEGGDVLSPARLADGWLGGRLCSASVTVRMRAPRRHSDAPRIVDVHPWKYSAAVQSAPRGSRRGTTTHKLPRSPRASADTVRKGGGHGAGQGVWDVTESMRENVLGVAMRLPPLTRRGRRRNRPQVRLLGSWYSVTDIESHVVLVHAVPTVGGVVCASVVLTSAAGAGKQYDRYPEPEALSFTSWLLSKHI